MDVSLHDLNPRSVCFFNIEIEKGAIHIIRDTQRAQGLRGPGVRDSVDHQITHGAYREIGDQPNCHVTFFVYFLKEILPKKALKSNVFL